MILRWSLTSPKQHQPWKKWHQQTDNLWQCNLVMETAIVKIY